jgi:reactive intermediate/imine deaminase
MNNPVPISVPELPPTNTTYSQAVRIGDLVYVSGQLGVDPATGKLVEGGAVAEYRQALNNVRRILEAAGTSMRRVVKTTIYMTNVDELVELNRVYAEFFPDSPPAKTGVEVKRLALGGLIEIEVIAAM